MSIHINGKNYIQAYYNGKYYDTAYYKNKCVLMTPDYNDYLMYAKLGYLKASDEFYVSYKNTPQISFNGYSGTNIARNPFSISFEVHSDSIKQYTILLLDIPGFINVKSEQNTLFFRFLWESKNQWKYVPTEIIKTGWNSVSLTGDGEKISLIINNKMFVLFDSKGTKISTCYRGKPGAYLQLSETAPISNAGSWEINTVYHYQTGGGSYPAVFGYSGTRDQQAPTFIKEGTYNRFYLSSNGYSWNINGGDSSFIFTDGKTYEFKCGFSGSNYYMKAREAYSENDFVSYFSLNSSIKVYCSVPFSFLNIRLNSNYWSAGWIDWTNTKITIDGNVFFDGSTAVEGTDFINVGCEKFENSLGEIYPSFPAINIKNCIDWQKIRNVKINFKGE